MSPRQSRIQTLQPSYTVSLPQPDAAPARPEILHLDGTHLVWRDTQRPTSDSPRRPITWDIRLSNGSLVLRADLDRQGVMLAVDFREVRGRLNELFLLEPVLESLVKTHHKRLRQSLMWQRNLDAYNPHIPPPEYHEGEGWSFSTARSCDDPIRGYPLDMPVLRPASGEIMADRHEERLWILYRTRLLRWAAVLGLNPELPMPHSICRVRFFHYWHIRGARNEEAPMEVRDHFLTWLLRPEFPLIMIRTHGCPVVTKTNSIG